MPDCADDRRLHLGYSLENVEVIQVLNPTSSTTDECDRIEMIGVKRLKGLAKSVGFCEIDPPFVEVHLTRPPSRH